jgi:hypothetical protein
MSGDPTLTPTSMMGEALPTKCEGTSSNNNFADLINAMPTEYCYLHNLTNLDARNTIWGVLKNMYDTNTNKINVSLNIEKSERMSEKMKNLSSTEKRQIEIENYNYEKTLYQLVFLRNALIVLLVLIIVPILKVSGIIDLSLGIPLFFGVLIILALYGVYELYYKSLNRDSTDFRKYNFPRVDARNQLKSMGDSITESEKIKCNIIKEIDDYRQPESPAKNEILDILVNQDKCVYSGTTAAGTTAAAGTFAAAGTTATAAAGTFAAAGTTAAGTTAAGTTAAAGN